MTYDVIPAMARAVARGWLAPSHALGHLLVDAVQAERRGEAQDARSNFRFRKFLLVGQLRRERTALAIQAMRLRQENRHGQ